MQRTEFSTPVMTKVAKKYIWWETGNQDLAARRVIAQVMTIGDFDDAQRLLEECGAPAFADALHHAEPGWFNERSWNYWHLRLGLVPSRNQIPAMPKRKLPS